MVKYLYGHANLFNTTFMPSCIIFMKGSVMILIQLTNIVVVCNVNDVLTIV